jgi:hypothetical protein
LDAGSTSVRFLIAHCRCEIRLSDPCAKNGMAGRQGRPAMPVFAIAPKHIVIPNEVGDLHSRQQPKPPGPKPAA